MIRAVRGLLIQIATILWLSLPGTAAQPVSSLDDGYRLMYSLQFEAAQHQFLQWQRQYPEDPLGPVSEAANHLFSEFERLGVLEAQFFVKDSLFKSRRKLLPDPALRARFDATLRRAEALAHQRLAADARNSDSLFALAMAHGLRADYAALVEKRNLAALRYTRQAAELASTLLAVEPDYHDAYLSTGIAKYVVGSMPVPFRWILRLAGYAGDKDQGLRELKLTAENGRFLAPFARILLAIASLRDNDKIQARGLLLELRDEFPSNPLFEKEIARIDGQRK